MPVFFLITEDYRLFRTFVRSPAVECLLRQTTLGILGISEGGGGGETINVKDFVASFAIMKFWLFFEWKRTTLLDLWYSRLEW